MYQTCVFIPPFRLLVTGLFRAEDGENTTGLVGCEGNMSLLVHLLEYQLNTFNPL